jgi:alpha-mannosidase
VIFEAKLKPLSLNRYSVYIDFEETKKIERDSVFTYDNGRKHVEIDEKTGLLKSYKIGGVEYLKDGFGLCSFDDNADPWGMGKNQLLRVGENEKMFSLSKNPHGVFEGMKSVQVIENGDVYLGIEAFFECDDTRARILYKIYKNNDNVDIDVNLYMGDINRIVKLKVPFNVSGSLIGQTAFGTDKLFTDARENVSHRFVALDTGDKCVSLMNTGVYGSHFENNALYMSLVRGVTYCAHPIGERELIPSNRFTKKIDQGESNYSFRLGVFDECALENAAQLFNQKPYALTDFPTGGKQKSESSPFSFALSNKCISLVTIKKADDTTNTYIVRLLNNAPSPAQTDLSLCGASIPLSFVPYEVKTIVLENGSLREADGLII